MDAMTKQTGVLLLLFSLLSVAAGQTEGRIRLVGGTSDSEGRVEVYANGEWGTVCDDYWDNIDATVTCRQLGYTGTGTAHLWGHFGAGTGAIHLDNVQCSGTESMLIDCTHGGVGNHNCGHYEDAGVSCSCSDTPTCAVPEDQCMYRRTEIVTVDHQPCPICRCASCPYQPKCPTNCKSGKTEYYDGEYCRRCRCVPQELPDVIIEPNNLSVGLLAGVVATALGIPLISLVVVCVLRHSQNKAAKSKGGNSKD